MCIPDSVQRLGLFLFLCAALSFSGQIQAAAANKDDCTAGELRSYSTVHSIGVEWDLAGDADHDAVCRVQYRIAGATTWRDALPLYRVDFFGWYGDTNADRAYNMLAGSLLFLQPGTNYEIKLDLADPDGARVSRVLEIKTRPIPSLPKNAKTSHVVPGKGGGDGSAANPFQGLSAAQAKVEPGDVCLLHAGSYGKCVFDRSGAPGRYLVWKNAGDGDVIFEQVGVHASHVWIEGMTFRRTDQANALIGTGTADDIVVSRNRLSGFHYSVLARRDCRDWYIADNTISGDNDPVTGGIGGEGIELSYSSGHTVAHNSITRTADGVSYPGRNCDIFGNDIFDVSDDGLEPDYGYANNRMWCNRLTNCHFSALSFQPMYCGPWYFIRNQIISSHIFKFRVQDRFLMAHNTIVCVSPMDGQMAHILTGTTRNNLFISAADDQPVWTASRPRGPSPYSLPPQLEPTWRTDIDYDGFDWGGAPDAFRWGERRFADLESFAAAVGIEQHGRRVRREEIFQRWQAPAKASRVPPDHLSLAPHTNAIDAGVVLPNIDEDFIGKAPDLGALEYGKPLPLYGPR